jgi:hypothetical protein
MESQRARWLVVDARDRAGAHATLHAAGHVVERRTEVGSSGSRGSSGSSGSRELAGALCLSDAGAIAHPEEVARELVERGIALTRLSVEEEDLEAQFLRLVGVTPRGDEHAH